MNVLSVSREKTVSRSNRKHVGLSQKEWPLQEQTMDLLAIMPA